MREPEKTHRKTRQSFNTMGHAHELTFSCFQRLPLLSKDRMCVWLLEALDDARRRWGFEIWAYVIMPEHAHVLIMPSKAPYDIAAMLKAIKQPVSQRVMAFIRENEPAHLEQLKGRLHRGRQEYHFWQPGGGFDRNVYEPGTAWKMVEYLHNNPVRRGLARSPVEWRWSSARFYAGLDSFDLAMNGRPPD